MQHIFKATNDKTGGGLSKFKAFKALSRITHCNLMMEFVDFAKFLQMYSTMSYNKIRPHTK